MHVLHDKSVLSPQTLAETKAEEQSRKVVTEFKQEVRAQQGRKVIRDAVPPDPRWDALPVVAVGRKKQRGLTLIEILVILCIVFITVALIVAASAKWRSRSLPEAPSPPPPPPPPLFVLLDRQITWDNRVPDWFYYYNTNTQERVLVFRDDHHLAAVRLDNRSTP